MTQHPPMYIVLTVIHQGFHLQNIYLRGKIYLVKQIKYTIISLNNCVLHAIFHSKGTCHGDDIAYLFKPAFLGKVPNKNSMEWKTIERLCDTWVSFAATGNPNNEIIASIQWEPIATSTIQKKANYIYKCLNISDELSFIETPDAKRMHFWDSIYETNNLKLF